LERRRLAACRATRLRLKGTAILMSTNLDPAA
jgi:hypothetical protein